jgi:hypothetical protein
MTESVVKGRGIVNRGKKLAERLGHTWVTSKKKGKDTTEKRLDEVRPHQVWNQRGHQLEHQPADPSYQQKPPNFPDEFRE